MVVALCLVAATAANAGFASAASRPDGGAAAEATVVADPCPGDLIAVDGGTTGPPMCSHGPDPGASPEELAAHGGESAEATPGIQCYGNGTGGARVQLVYVYSGTNRLATLRADIEQRAAEINAIYDESAASTGGHRYVRWVTDANCNLTVTAVQVPTTAIPVEAFTSTLLPYLKAHGLNANSRKYLIWADTGTSPTIGSGSCYGVGTLYADENPDPTENFNNLYMGFTRIDDKCLFALFDRVGGKVEAHELMHTLGAVQGRLVLTDGTVWTVGSPHRTLYGHCTDDYDIMCYADGPGTVVRVVCTDTANEMRFDCNHDDYFDADPAGPTANYLATHWNTADSSWLESEPGAAQAPGAPLSLRGAPGNNSVALTWAKPSYDGGEPVVGYQVYRNGQLLVPVTNPASTADAEATAAVTSTAPSFTDTGLVNGTTYEYQVAAVNSVGAGTRTAVIPVMAGVPRPDAQLATARTGPFAGNDVYAPSMTANPQTQTQPVARGGSVTSYVRLQNDRPGFDSFKVKVAASGASGYTVRYFRGTTDITSAVEHGSYTVENVAPGAYVDLKVKITATTTAAAHSTRSVTVTVKSKTTKTIKDVVQTRAART